VGVVVVCHDASALIKDAVDDKMFLKIGGLLQTHATITKDAAPTGEDVGTEFFIRRMRLMVAAQLNEKVNFFVETDSPNFGKNGDFAVDVFIQDAYAELNLHEAFQLDVGMIILPFSHHAMQGATSLLGVDYRTAVIKYPNGSHKVWRDYGVMVRGLLSKWVEYRVGVFNGTHGNTKPVTVTDTLDDGTTAVWTYGTDPRNETDMPRVTARLTLNLFDAEGGAGLAGMFYDGAYLAESEDGIVSTKRVLSLGGSVDWQRGLNVQYAARPALGTADAPTAAEIDERTDYFAVAGDVFFDIPLGAKKLMSINGQANVYYYNHGDRTDGLSFYDFSGDTSMYTGVGLAAELGFRYSAFMPLFAFEWFDSNRAAADEIGDVMAIWGGLNWMVFADAFNLKLQVGATNKADTEWMPAGQLQAQLLF
jgi:hypothetical protein